MGPARIEVARYLFKRLHELGVRSVHGVPGDYNLSVMDYMAPLRWVGNANELNAGYAADGYARIKGISALITSYGVGELSAINAIGAAYAEKSPVVHIVGTPPLTAQRSRACLHHSLGDGNLRVFAEMYKSVTVAQANLEDASTAPWMIDETLRQCISQSRPVYIEIPTDMVRTKILDATQSKLVTDFKSDEAYEDDVVRKIMERLRSARRPLIIADGFTRRFGMRDDVSKLVEITKIPTLTTPFGKGIVNESLPSYQGVYLGAAGEPVHKAWVDSRDLVLRFGPLDSDVNTFGFTNLPPARATITFDKNSIHFGDDLERTVQRLSTKSVVSKLLAQLSTSTTHTPESYPDNPYLPRRLFDELPAPESADKIDQYSFWLRISSFLRKGDIILTEAGTSSYGGQSFILPQDTTVINSSIWLSIGHTLGACQGASLAQREMADDGSGLSGRTILFIGDGSIQMSIQAISDIIRNRLDATIFVINNNGYTIERIIHGFAEDYNGIQPWRNLEAPSFFGAPQDDPTYPVRTSNVTTWGELTAVLQERGIKEGRGLSMIEVSMDMGDAPQSLRAFVEFLKARNAAISA